MYTKGFSCQVSGYITNGVAFTAPQTSSNQIVSSTYIAIPTNGTEGVIVYVNPQGSTCVWPYAFIGYNPISATQILSSATIDDVVYTTTATPLYWGGTTGI
jgi:hypothetical protein